MRNAAPNGVLALPLVLFAGTVSLLATAAATRAPAHDPRARVELELVGVLPVPEGQAGILVLREKGKDTILPLFVPDGRRFAPSASGGSLLDRAIAALGGRLSEVEVERAEETSAGAKVRLTQSGKPLELQAVPSESIALAIAAGVPIVASRQLLDEEGLTAEDLARTHGRDKKHPTTKL
jgi:uncharacterized protein